MVRLLDATSMHCSVRRETDISRLRLLHLRVRHRIATRHQLHTDSARPVIIAEDMIGCAMYELVGAVLQLGRAIADWSRSVLATTTL